MVVFSLVFSQSSETANLLKQSEQEIFTNPKESIKTIEFLLNSEPQTALKPQLYYLMSRADFTLGNYELALKNAFKAKNLAKENKNNKVYNRSLILISQIFSFLRLQNEVEETNHKMLKNSEAMMFLKLESTKKSKPQAANPELKKVATNHLVDFQNEALIELSKNYIELKDFDSAVYFAQKAVSQTEKSRLGNYFETKSYLVLGDAYFSAKKNNLAQNAYFTALEKCNSFDNPFLKKEIHHKISTTFLADKNIEKFNFHNRQALNFENLADENENNAANTAYQLLSAEQDEKLTSEKNKYRTVFIATLGLFITLILLKILLFFRNRNLLKTYETLNNYLNKKPTPEEGKPSAEQENKGSGLLKESEEQILAGLKKFESSKKFTAKEMSLGMLAAQLNTNTKYLSEVINRHKQKNFNSYINELRINFITEKIKNEPNYLNYKVSYLAEESGFSSHSSFTTVFKSIVGISPIAFVELIKNQKETRV